MGDGLVADVVVDEPVTTDRIVTVPNVITVVRLCCLPVFLWLLFGRDNRLAAGWLLGALGATDFLDGYIARHFNQVSSVGKVLDPVADRLLLFTSGIAILVDGSVPRWLAIVVLAREGLVSIAVLVLAALGASRIDVTWFGKAGTFGLMFAFPFFLGAESSASYREVAEVLAWVAAIPGLIFSAIATALYVPLASKALRDGRSASAARVGSA